MIKAQLVIKRLTASRSGFSLVEALLAVSVFALIVTTVIGALIYGRESTALAGQRARATFLAEEGLEAIRNIRDENFANLQDGAYGLDASTGQWTFSGTSDTTGIFTRQVTIATVGVDRKQITSLISWQQSASRPGTITFATILTNWKQ